MFLLMLMLSVLIGGCSGGGFDPKAPPAHAIARSDAEALVRRYLQAKVEGEFEAAEELLLPRVRHLASPGTPEWTQFAIAESTEMNEGWLIETREYRTMASEPSSTIARAYYLVVRENSGKLYIDLPEFRWEGEKGSRYKTVASTVHPDARDPDRRLIMTEAGNRVLAEIEPDLPRLFRPFGAPADIQFGVGDNGLGALALSPDLESVAFVTRGTHAFLGVASRNGEVRGLDLWFEGGAGELAWSFDGRYLAATNSSPRGIFVLELWDLATGQPVKVSGLPDGKDVSRLQWLNGTLHLRVSAAPWLVHPATGQAITSP